jgi:RHS repeat-associated protein
LSILSARARRRRVVLSLLVATALAVGITPASAAAETEASTAAAPVSELPDSKGREFWLAFPSNYSSTPDLKLFLTGELDTSAQVEVPGLGFAQSVQIRAGEVTTVQLPAAAQLTGWDAVEAKGVHVTAAQEITVYGLNRVPFTTDAFLGLPVDILGTEYYSLSYDRYWSQLAVVATVDDTVLRVTPTASTGGRVAGQAYEVVLDEGQTYQLTEQSSTVDLSGSYLEADAPIAAFGSARCANVPREYAYCDHLVEQLFPTETWGERFVTMPLATRSGGDTMRIMAAEDGTVVRLNGSVVATLDAGAFHEQVVEGAAEITSEQPVLVAQYSNGSTYDGTISDPFMMLVPPHEQYLDSYTVTTPATGFRTNYVNVVVSSANAGSIVLDGQSVPASAFLPIGTSGFSGAQLPVTLGSHHLTSGVPFGLFVYGFDADDSYGYPGGLSLSPVARVTDVEVELGVTPVGQVGEEDCLQVRVTDRDGGGVGGVRVDIAISGANPDSGSAITTQSGVASYCYTGARSGLDVIVARVGAVSDSAEKRWEQGQGSDYYTRPAAASYGYRLSSGYVGDPVNTATGNLVGDHVDLPAPGPLAGLDLTRTYNSLDGGSGVLGVGWSTQLDVRLDQSDPAAVTNRFADGRVATFLRREDGSFARVEEVAGDLLLDADGQYRLVMDDGEVHEFDDGGWLARRTFADGTAVTFERDQAGRTTALRGAGSSAILLDYDHSGLLSAATTADGRTVTYAYEQGALVAVTDPAGSVTEYSLDQQRRITAITDGSGVIVAEASYDEQGRVATQGAPGLSTLSFTYDGGGRTTVTDVGDGSQLVFNHDPQARLLTVEDPYGALLRRTYDDDGNLVQAVDRVGSALERTYDVRGNVITSKEQDGSTTRHTYDERSRLTSTATPSGAVTRFVYEGDERVPSEIVDANGHVLRFDVRGDLVVSTADADGVRTTATYDELRRTTSTTDGLGRTTRYGYDPQGNETSVTTPSGAQSRRTFDAVGQLVEEIDPVGATTRYDYDRAGRVTRITDPVGAQTRSMYDDFGRLVSVTDSLGHITRHEYDSLGRMTAVVSPGGATTRTEYGPLSRVTAVTDPVGAVTRYSYDANGTRTATTNALGGRMTETVDHRGRVTSRTDELGRTTTYAYDTEDRLLSETDPAGKVARYRYDLVGNLVQVVDRTGAATLRDYTPGQRLAAETDATGRTTRFAYDAAGQHVTTTSPAGRTTTFGYDDDGALVLERSPGGLTTGRRYDAAGREVELSLPGRGTTRRTYTPRGELATEEDESGARRAFAYDAAGRLVEATAPNGAVTRYEHDERGNEVARIAPDGSIERWEHDLADRVIAAVDQLGRRTTTTYDALGRLLRVDDPTGRSSRQEYDAAGQLLALVAADGARRTFGYDARGWRISASDVSGETTYAYDDEGRLVLRRLPDGQLVAYAYDAAGRRTSMTRPDGRVEQRRYDEDGRLLAVAAGGAAARFSYDADGRLVEERLPGGKDRRYAYTNGLLTGYAQDSSPYQAGATIVRDAAGRRIGEERAGSHQAYRYDQAGQLVGWGSTTAEYDSRGNRASLATRSGTTQYAYDAAGQLTGASDRTGVRSYGYDAAGRRTLSSAGNAVTTTEYDSWGQPARITTRIGDRVTRVLSLVHDVDGQVVSVDDGREKTAVLWDTARDIAQPIALASGKQEVELVHGEQRAFVLVEDKPVVLDQDSSGSVLRSSDSSSLGQAASYDPFGVPVDQGVDIGLGLGYRGELVVDGLVHLRARDYDPLVGAFTSPDPLDRAPGATTVSNAYAYADNDPLNRVDPLGEAAVGDDSLARYGAGGLQTCAAAARTSTGPRLSCNAERNLGRTPFEVATSTSKQSKWMGPIPLKSWMKIGYKLAKYALFSISAQFQTDMQRVITAVRIADGRIRYSVVDFPRIRYRVRVRLLVKSITVHTFGWQRQGGGRLVSTYYGRC